MNVLIDVFSYKFSFLTDLLRYLFLFLDGIIYNLIQPLYAAALNLADIRDVLQQDQLVEMISSRIYIFLGLFMFFKLAFSIISMIANPDLVNDKQKGLGKVITNVIITLILVVVMPSVFKMAYELQDTVINGGYLRGIFGTTPDGKSATGNEGVELGKKVFRVFINPINENGITENAINLFEKPTDRVDVGALNTNDAMTRDTKNVYDISYMMVISTVVGVMMVMSFLKIGVEIALRSLKLLVLEAISPIAIISYVDPASASKGLFAKWSSMAIKTYLSLFLRLGMIYFITSILSGINIEDFGNGLGTLPSILLILALLAFMQSAPKMLEELFGYKPGEDGKAINGIVKGALGIGGAAVGAAGAYAMMRHDKKKLEEDPSWQPGKFRKVVSGAKDFKNDLVSAAKAGYKNGSSGGGGKLPDNLNYKQAQKQQQKQMDELQAKRKEADKIRELGATEMVNYDSIAAAYSGNTAGYTAAEAAIYTSLAGNPTKQTAYADTIGKQYANTQTYSKPVYQKKNKILEYEYELSDLTEQKTFAQADLNRIISSGDKLVTDSATGLIVRYDSSTQYSTDYTTAISRVTNVDSQIAEHTQTIEKQKSSLESLLKDPLYAKDAKIDLAIKTGKANKV